MQKIWTCIMAFGLLIGNINSQNGAFSGHAGLYLLGITDQPIPSTDYAKPFVDGAAVRVRWSSLETAPGVFNWSYLDGELTKAEMAGKKISISILGNPDWLDGIGVQRYYYIDKNPNHATFGDTLPDYIPWDLQYLDRVQMLNQRLGERYSGNPVVSYCNSIAGFFSRNLPSDDVLTPDGWQPIWQSFGYHADTIVARMKVALDTYMAIFLLTPQWNSMDYQAFEPAATGHARNYISQQYALYGLEKYPDRFGVWREDLAGCNPGPNVNSTSQWYPVIQNPCRNGAQMLWNVQDGPDRMNQCGIEPNTKATVLDSAINRGIALGMRYMEVYKADMEDAGLQSTLTAAHQRLHTAVNDACKGLSSGILPLNTELPLAVSPNPGTGIFNVHVAVENKSATQIWILDQLGRNMVVQPKFDSENSTMDLSGFPSGIYLLKLAFDTGKTASARIVLLK